MVKSVQPQTGSLFVRLFLGRVNVRVQSKKDQLKLRDEFNKFKDRANLSELLQNKVPLTISQTIPSDLGSARPLLPTAPCLCVCCVASQLHATAVMTYTHTYTQTHTDA